MKKLFALIFGLFISLIILLISEWIVRITIPEIRPYGTDQNLIADSVFFESPGLRPETSGVSNGAIVNVDRYNCRISSVKTDTKKRGWLLLGDSVTMGIGIDSDSTFAGRIQNNLDSLQIYNPSLIGFSYLDYFNTFRHFIISDSNKLKITNVTLFWCLNDIYNGIKSVEQPGGNWRSLFKNILIRLRANSRLYLFLKGTIFDRPKSYYLFDKEFYSNDNKDLIEAINVINQMNDIAGEKRISFTVVLLPYEYQLRKGDRSPQELFKTILVEKDIINIDLFDQFVKESDFEGCYLYGDGIHFSEKGHKLIADFFIDDKLNLKQ
jgi:lysophospholipase L1-like esterase